MPFLKNVNLDGIENVTVMINQDIDVRFAFKSDNKIHIAFSETEKVKGDVLIEFEDGSGLCNSSSTSNIDFLIVTDKDKLDRLIQVLSNIRAQYKP